ncbi:c-type cytochrome [Primorskyibacter sp. 2E107]|uniref:c-type cytochrome n=1 Tax=Primorskyibacter sp. 2E107 TaxID=3403458 RepID=UPI003AF786E5
MYRALLALIGLLCACQPTPDTTAPGKAIFDSQCADCHGSAARGDGPLASELPKPPPDLTGLQARNGGIFPYEAIFAQIYGYPGRYHLGLMPEFGPALEGDAVEWKTPSGEVIRTPRRLIALVDYLSTLQQ